MNRARTDSAVTVSGEKRGLHVGLRSAGLGHCPGDGLPFNSGTVQLNYRLRPFFHMFRADHQKVMVDREPGVRTALVGLIVNQPLVSGIEPADRCLDHSSVD